MVEYSKVSVLLSNSQLNKLKSVVKNQTGVAIRMNEEYKELVMDLRIFSSKKKSPPNLLTNVEIQNLPKNIVDGVYKSC